MSLFSLKSPCTPSLPMGHIERLSLEANWYLVSSSVIFGLIPRVWGLKLLPKPSSIHIWNENGWFIRVRYVPNINWPPWAASKKRDPNVPPIFFSNMDWAWLQDQKHLKEWMYKFKDGWARDQISIGLHGQPLLSSSAIFEFIHPLF